MRVRRSLTIKQMAMVAAVAVVFIFVFIVIQLFYFVQQNRNDTISRMENMADSVRIPLAQAVLKADIPQAEEVLATLKPAGILSRIDVVLPDQLQTLGISFVPEGKIPRLATRLFSLPVQVSLPLYALGQPGNSQPLAFLVLQADSRYLYRFIISTLSILLTTYLLLALILTVSISWFINRLVIHPIRRVAHELDNMSLQGIGPHQLEIPESHQDDEIGMLVRSYNRNQQACCQGKTGYSEQPSLLVTKNNRLAGFSGSEFAIWLQPQVNMSSGQVVGAEVLLRQQQSDEVWALPEGLIERIEDCGLMVTVGSWVLEESCRVLSVWQRRGIMMPLSVNLSVLQLMHKDMVPALLNLLERYQVDPATLTIEITESRRIDDPQVAANILRPLHDAGVRIALDDFGMGYACLRDLHHLKSVPVDILKIDKSFIQGLPGDAAMVEAIVTLARSLGLKIVAEGIENAQQKDWLIAHDVTHAQGYLFSQALPVAQFESRYLD
ncbi:EAL domain-containing protein [uncultured Cedecea sp.]|uniref:EAL domain-containing protein n=1 Tax=uncultured Cedecea sp. TaxID=988762 RepID=UPI0026172F41|nr:EAL domain-containing protein [uncultured Cedecea sp.]